MCFFVFCPSAFNEMDGRKALAARDEWSPTADVFRSMHVSSLRSWLVINCNGRAKKLRLGQDCEKCGLEEPLETPLEQRSSLKWKGFAAV
ncbi:MAG TPA: hypothetical protein VGF01_03500, partial [Terracidiphilus sp.]